MKIIFTLLAGFLAICGMAQPQFQQYMDNNAQFFQWQMASTADSGYIIPGNSSGGMLTKLDKNGQLQWSNEYTGIGNLLSAEELPGGGYISCGYAVAGSYAQVLRTDAGGNVVWARQSSQVQTMGLRIHRMSSGDYMMAGIRNSGVLFLVRLDTAGNLLWEKSYPLSVDFVNMNAMQPTSNDGIIATGTVSGNGVGLLKIDSSGNIIWHKVFAAGSVHGNTVKTIGNSGYLITGHGTDHDLFYTDTAGNLLWHVKWPMQYISNVSEGYYSVLPDGDRLLVYNNHYTGPSSTTILFFEYDKAGNLLWSNEYGTSQTNLVSGTTYGVISRQNNITFYSPKNGGMGFYMAAVDSDGTATCNEAAYPFSPQAFATTTGTLTSVSTSFTPVMNPLAVTAAAFPLTITSLCPLSTAEPAAFTNFRCYPNPANNELTFETTAAMEHLTVYDLTGRSLMERTLSGQENTLNISVSALPAGLYTYRITFRNGEMTTGKFSVVR